MLKIKDEFDLEKLKDYGFKEYRNKTYSSGVYHIDNGELLIENENINNKIEKILYINPCGENDCIYCETLDLLFNLIKDGIVEKVSDEDENNKL